MKILYGAEWCPSCKTLKKQLEAAKIRFTYVDADDKKVMNMLSEIGVRSLPFAEIDGEYFGEPKLEDFR
jgi:glutaredoxin